MKELEVDRTYVFVRVVDGVVKHAEFRRRDDGSASVLKEDWFEAFECHPDSWRRALEGLSSGGFVELDEARARGLVPPGWEVPHWGQ